MRALLAALALACSAPGRAQEAYGAKGIYPVYETGGQWVIFDKDPKAQRGAQKSALSLGTRFLVVGSRGSELFTVTRASATYGGACRKNRPVKLRAALLRGPRSVVGSPIIGIRVKADFNLRGSEARYLSLANEVDEGTYSRLGDAVKSAALSDITSGVFGSTLDDDPGRAPPQDPSPEQVQMKIDFGARLAVRGLQDPFVFVEASQFSSSYRRCLRLADGGKLVARCVEMPQKLMAETALLRFVAYDPSGQDNPFLLAYTPTPPLWGDERWGFALRSAGPRLFLFDAMDPRCRDGF
ncbi:MAG: hypothetical protein PHU21_08305 [Elusimicrobia bacterium]|nr:hypothetical protein [Elusimicrobiota bacterium]